MKLSLVIPAYNEEDQITDCLDAVAEQEVMPDEVILVDNNCTDKTMEIAAKYPFVVMIHEPRQGIVFARNAGFNVATGDVIGRIDSDTNLPPDWCRKVKEIFKDTKIDAVTGAMYWRDMPAKQVLEFIDTSLRSFAFYHGPRQRFLFGSNMAIRKSIWDKIKDEVCTMQKFHEDTDLGIHVSMAGGNIMFSRELIAGMSPRRMAQNWRSTVNYIEQALEAYRYHNISPVTLSLIYYPIAIMFHPGLRLILKSYDPKSKSWSTKKLLSSLEAQKVKVYGVDETTDSQYNGGKL